MDRECTGDAAGRRDALSPGRSRQTRQGHRISEDAQSAFLRSPAMAKAIHMMIRVLDEARSVAFYEKALGLQTADRYEFDSFTLVYLSNAETPFELELTINHTRKEPYDLGTGYGHVAFTVDDLGGEHA